MAESEDRGIVPQRRVYETPFGPREMLGPYDIDFERQERLERLTEQRESVVEAQDGASARRLTLELLNVIFAEPFTEEEFKKLIPLRVAEWQADFFGDYDASSEGIATRQVELTNRAQRRMKSPQNSKATTTRRTR